MFYTIFSLVLSNYIKNFQQTSIIGKNGNEKRKSPTWSTSRRFLVEVASGLEPLCPVLQTGD